MYTWNVPQAGPPFHIYKYAPAAECRVFSKSVTQSTFIVQRRPDGHKRTLKQRWFYVDRRRCYGVEDIKCVSWIDIDM